MPLPLIHATAKQAGEGSGALMFAPVQLDGGRDVSGGHSMLVCTFLSTSLMTEKHVKELITAAAPELLRFTGIKLLEIEVSADINHRINILRDRR